MTTTTTADYVGMAQAWIVAHARLLISLLAVVALVIGAIWLLRKVFEALNPKRESDVWRALKAWKRAAHAARDVTLPRELRTSGNARVEERLWGRVRGLTNTSTHHVIVLQPERGFLRWIERRVVLVANHLVPDARLDVLNVRALGLSEHDGVWWPDDDLGNEATREAWRRLLEEDAGERITTAALQVRIHQWYMRVVELSVAVARGLTAMDDATSNIEVAMKRDLARDEPLGIPPDAMTGSEVSQHAP
jgi:hypothetical protein